MNILAWFYWDPPREAFTIPYFDIAVVWYGILFAMGFIAGYYILLPILRREFQDNKLATLFAERITWFVVLGTIIGARLGHVFFYEWDYYKANPLEILMIRKGGLASHGGTIGIMIALVLFLYIYRKTFPQMTFIKLMDLLAIPTSVTICFIRIGNFFNQEILGTPTDKPWAVIFGHPSDGTLPVPRHPVQLYEALAYLCTFFILFALWKMKGDRLKPGVIVGIFFILVFGSRFFLEFLKEPQSPIDSMGLQMGQYLSIPFVLLGIGLLLNAKR
jgi:phosphatidylglycerol---prolipoprotein diacylglyceryl transferase